MLYIHISIIAICAAQEDTVRPNKIRMISKSSFCMFSRSFGGVCVC